MVPLTNLPDQSPPVFRFAARQVVGGVFPSEATLLAPSFSSRAARVNWLIGGAQDDDANILIGMRASFSIMHCAKMTVRGNYVHTEIPSFRWSQVHALAVVSPCPELIVEHNIIRHGQWVVRGLTGEFRYNLVLDADAHNFIIGPQAGTRIHHNIFARYCTVDPNLNATIGVIYKGDGIEIFNNTFDAGGKSLARPWYVPAVEIGASAFVASLRNNVFYNHPTNFSTGSATIRPGFTERKTDPGPARLGYADYNLFYNPDARPIQNYAVSVMGKTERLDGGFGKHDAPAGGAKDAQVQPKFKGPLPTAFPFTDGDIRARRVTVAKMLAHYRDAYAPADGSPLIGAGDPADGAGSFIGAVGLGKDGPNDRFGGDSLARTRKRRIVIAVPWAAAFMQAKIKLAGGVVGDQQPGQEKADGERLKIENQDQGCMR